MIWVPDLYIRQLREMRVLTLFEEISSLRLYPNSTISLSIGATIIIKCDMDFVLYPLDVQKCAVDFSSCKWEGQINYFCTLTALLSSSPFFRQVHGERHVVQVAGLYTANVSQRLRNGVLSAAQIRGVVQSQPVSAFSELRRW